MAKTYVWTGSELREMTPEEEAHLKSPRQTAKLKAGDTVFISIPGEHFQKFLDADKIRDSFAQKVGLAFMAWTSCCDTVFDIFESLTRLDKETAAAIFRRVRNDRTQREITLDVAKIRLSKDIEILSALEEALKQLGELASERNMAAHVSFGMHFDENWNVKMKPLRSIRPWDEKANAEEQVENLAKKLNECGESLFNLLLKINAEASL